MNTINYYHELETTYMDYYYYELLLLHIYYIISYTTYMD